MSENENNEIDVNADVPETVLNTIKKHAKGVVKTLASFAIGGITTAMIIAHITGTSPAELFQRQDNSNESNIRIEEAMRSGELDQIVGMINDVRRDLEAQGRFVSNAHLAEIVDQALAFGEQGIGVTRADINQMISDAKGLPSWNATRESGTANYIKSLLEQVRLEMLNDGRNVAGNLTTEQLNSMAREMAGRYKDVFSGRDISQLSPSEERIMSDAIRREIMQEFGIGEQVNEVSPQDVRGRQGARGRDGRDGRDGREPAPANALEFIEGSQEQMLDAWRNIAMQNGFAPTQEADQAFMRLADLHGAPLSGRIQGNKFYIMFTGYETALPISLNKIIQYDHRSREAGQATAPEFDRYENFDIDQAMERMNNNVTPDREAER